jgi:nucleotide-binding universal stress UspA family protein
MDSGPILVPLDGSEKDARALAVARALANLSGAGVRLIHVLDRPAHGDESDGLAKGDAEQRLAERAGSLAADRDVPITWGVVTGEDVVEAVVRNATNHDALVVVMGTRAPNVVGRVIAGSVADRVMRECTRPVVLVPPGTADMAGKRIRLGRVLVPLDGSELAERALDFFLRLRYANTLEYVLLTVMPPAAASWAVGAEPGAAESSEPGRAASWLEQAAARVRMRGATAVETQVAEGADPAELIAGAVREYLVDMICMSTRGTGGLRRLVLGSVAEAVVRASEVPVVLLTPATLARMHQS